MIFRQITSSGDWTFGKGIYSYATGSDAVGLEIKTRLLSWKGDCFFALQDFVDWLGRLDKGQENNLNTELQAVILASFGVVSIDSFTTSLDRNTRKYSATYKVSTIFSTSVQNKLDLVAGLPPGS